MERQKFEDSFKDAFKEAEISPSEKVWTNIELELEKEAGDKIRRKLIFYKMLAAASIAFALSIGGLGYYMVSHNVQLADKAVSSATPTDHPSIQSTPGESTTNVQIPTPSNSISDADNASASSPASSSGVKSNDYETKHDILADDVTLAGETSGPHSIGRESGVAVTESERLTNLHQQNGTEKIDGIDIDKQPIVSDNSDLLSPAGQSAVSQNSASDERRLPEFFKLHEPTLVMPRTEADPVALMMARLEQEEKLLAAADKKDQHNKTEKVWTSVGFAAGGFSSVNRSASPTTNNVAYANVSSVPDKQAKASGIAYSMGVSFGTKVAKRWVLQGGVNYLTQSSDYIATNVVAENNYQSLKAESINALEALPLMADAANASNKLAPTVPYSVNNSMKFFSVPVQAGYLVVNRKFGLQLNAGLSTDLFLQNTITPESGSLDKSTQSGGGDSPYRSVNFSGLMGTELSYRLGQRYRVALNPGLRYPLNSLYKSDVGIQSTPITFDVGLRFRYIFQ